jgi:hypothetical protein
MTTLPPALRARQWAPGQSGNPSGKGGLYHEMQRLAREFTPEATEILIGFAKDEEEETSNRIVSIRMLYERAWGAPKDYDPKTDEAATRKPKFDPSLFSREQLVQIERTLRMVASAQTEAEDG